jgi:hypothetical protein
MAFDFHLHVPETSRRGQVIQMLMAEEDITPEQAAERLLEEAAQLHLTSSEKPANIIAFNTDYLSQLRERGTKRAEPRQSAGDPMASIRPETPENLIGYLADAPEVAQAIRDLAYERRAQTYGI